jgi:hypothetical protein
MRRFRIIGALAAVAICAMAALASPAFAVKEKKVFGEWQAEVVGQNLETSPVQLKIEREEVAEVFGLQLGNYKFGPIIRSGTGKGKPDYEHPCTKAPKVTGEFLAEPGTVNKSKSIIIHMAFGGCITRAQQGGVVKEKKAHFTLSFKLEPNHSVELGKSENAITIEEAHLSFKGALGKCPVVIPRQTIPGKVNDEKEYEEIASYSNESEEVEKTPKNEQRYPNGKKERVTIEFEEKFKGINTYVAQENPVTHEYKGCTSTKGEENPKEIEEGPYKGWLEYNTGHIFAEIPDLEAKNGELRFVEPI